MKAFIELDVFHSFPNEFDENMEWYEFPVLSLELVVDEEAPDMDAIAAVI
jgi:hypothetical protein